MNVLAFVIVAFMLAMYVLLDGYDLGIGSITPIIARTDAERDGSMRSIGPYWNGNEVWLIAGGGVLFALFPRAYASSFSGFYFEFIIVLWLLMFRGVALELRSHFPSEIWHNFWDFCFSAASILLILIFGVALGNLLRGVPLDSNGYFEGTLAFLLNWYAVLVGIFAIVTLALHGTTFYRMRVIGPPAERARALSMPLWTATIVLYVIVTAATFGVRGMGPEIGWLDIFALIGIASLILVAVQNSLGSARGAFIASSVFLAALMAQAAGTIFPYLLPSFPAGRGGGISIYNAAPSAPALVSAIAVTIVALIAVIIYGGVVTRQLAGKIRVGE